MKSYPVDPAIFKEARIFHASENAIPVCIFEHRRVNIVVHYARTDCHKKELKSLISQTKAIMDISKKTGMYFIQSLELGEYNIACFSLREKLNLSAGELQELCLLARSKLAEKGIAPP